MNHAIGSKAFIKTIKLVSYLLLVFAIIYLLGKGNFIIRSIVLTSILIGIIFIAWRRWHSANVNDEEIGYWSGLDNFDIGIFDSFGDEDSEEYFDSVADEYIKPV